MPPATRRHLAAAHVLSLTCWLLAAVCIGPATAATYYVANSGDDGDPGSLARPWRTIAKANATLEPGDTVLIRGGEYNEAISPERSGTPGNCITYQAYRNETPLIDRSVVLTNWRQHDGNVWWTSFPRNAVPVWEDSFEESEYHWMYWYQNDLAGVDGPGKLFRDAEAGRMYVWTAASDDPNQHTMRSSVGRGASFTKDYIVLDGIHMKWLHRGIDASGCNHCIFRNLRIECASAFGILLSDDAHHNQVLDCTIAYIGSWYWDEGDGIHISGHHNLIEGNDISRTGHNPITSRGFRDGVKAHHNIYQNNRTHDAGSSGLDSNWDCHHEVWRNNVSYRNTGAGMQTDSNNIAIYGNVFHTNGSGLAIYTTGGRSVFANRFFNNTLYENNSLYLHQDQQHPCDHECQLAEWGGTCADNRLENNIVFNSSKPWSLHFDGLLRDNLVRRNDLIGPDGARVRVTQLGGNPLSWWEENRPSQFSRNTQLDPLFLNATQFDLRLRPDSPCRDAGVFLTRTTSAGSGLTIPVEDARYFCDGFGITDGDVVQLEGDTKRMRVVEVDYERNTLTLSEGHEWTEGQGVSMPYEGRAPDIGALEWGMVASLPHTPDPAPPGPQ